MSNTINKYIIITFSIVNNPYSCHPHMFITGNYSSKFTVMSFWALAPKPPAVNGIPKKSLDTPLSRYLQLVFGIKSCWPQNDDAFNDNVFSSMIEFPNLSKKCSIHSLSISYKDLDLKKNFLLSSTTDHKLSKSRVHRNIVSIRYQRVCREIFKKWVDYF